MPGAFSTTASLIDALISMCAALPAVTSANPPVDVFDGFPGPNMPATFIAIGGFSDDVMISGRETWETIGTRSRIEEYEVLGYVYSWVGGDDNLGQFSPSDAQKTARDQANTLVQAIEAQLLHDPSLTAQNNGDPLVTWTLFSATGLKQPAADDPDIAKGRWAQYDFAVQVYNYLSGSY